MSLLHGGHVGGILEDIVDGDETRGGSGATGWSVVVLLLVAGVGDLYMNITSISVSYQFPTIIGIG